ncbi:pilus assembly protein TadG-related protein [Vibrio sp. H11]|uniref:pilus assembly protein TadG-related protein n=1 Tax=Vibrio sp. H11 TaxID=2565928 RepID=UPI0010A6432A|nr:pilus assembly protein TadG-related protein [Vibrio sp. H11]
MAKRDQSGAITLWLAAALLSLVIFTSVAIDTARLAFQRQQLQSIADLAASEIGLNNPYFIQSEGASNLATMLSDKYKDQVDSLTIQNGYATIQNNRWVIDTSTAAVANGYPASKVVVTKTVPQSMIAGGLFNDNEITLMAEAAVQKAGIISFGIGSKTLSSADSGILNGLLGGLLGTSLDLDVASYDGLANTSLKLGSVLDALALDLGLGSPQEVLETNISLLSVLETYLNVLDNGDQFPDGLNLIINQLALVESIPDIVLGDVFTLSENGTQGAALETSLSALDLIKTTIFAANKDHFVNIPALSLGVPGITDVTVKTQIIEPPQYTVATLPINEDSPPSVKNSQVELTLTASLDLVDGITDALSSATLGLANIEVSPLEINVTAAQAKATLTQLNLNRENPQAEFLIQDSLVSIEAKPISISIGLLIFSPIVISINIDISDNRDLTPTLIALDQLPYSSTAADSIQEDPSRAFTTAFDINIDAPLGLGAPLSIVTAALNSFLSPLLSNVLTAIVGEKLAPALQALGVPLGGADLWVDSIQASSHGLIL